MINQGDKIRRKTKILLSNIGEIIIQLHQMPEDVERRNVRHKTT